MTSPQTLKELIAARRNGTLGRDDYWRALQLRHAALGEYVPLVRAAGLEALEITPGGTYIRLQGGVRFSWDPSDFRSPPVVLLNDGQYESPEWSIVRILGGAATTVLDVGANVGWYSIRLAADASRSSHVHAFEPMPETYRALVGNIAINGLVDRVTAHLFGLSDREGSVPFYVPDRTGSVAASERVLFDDEPQRVKEATLRRLDDVAEELGLNDIGFVKCDIEGGEFGFVRGAERVLREQRPTMLLEMLRKWSKVYEYHPNDILEWMRARDYVCAAVTGDHVERVDRVTDETTATNFLFTHRQRSAFVAGLLQQGFRHVRLD